MASLRDVPPDDLPDAIVSREVPADDLPQAAAPETIVDTVMQGPVGQAGLGVLEGASMLPGLPVDAGVFLGNVAGWATGKPWRPIEDDPALARFGGRAWYDFAKRNLGVPEGPAPKSDAERIARKAGIFAGGALPFGPAGMVPAATATAGSEVGRAVDPSGVGEVVGAIAGGFVPGLVRGATTAGLRKPSDVPDNAALKTAANKAYQEAEDAGVIVAPSGTQRLAETVKADLANEGYSPKLHAGVSAVLDELDTLSQGNVTLKGVDVLRKVAQSAAQNIDPSTSRLGSRIIDHIDDFIDNLTPADVFAGDAATGASALRSARDLWRRMRKSEMVDEAVGKADRRATSTGSGGNTDNAIRQNIRALLDNKKKARNFSTAEKALMERVVRGGAIQNLVRLVGKLSPQGNGLMAALGIGATAAAPGIGWAPSVAGLIAKPLAEAVTRRNANILSQTIRAGNKADVPTGSRAARIAFEARRRARLAAKSAVPAIPGAVQQD